MDVIARDKKGRVISVEIQRKPYMFQGQRESCYLAELVLDRYKKINVNNLTYTTTTYSG